MDEVDMGPSTKPEITSLKEALRVQAEPLTKDIWSPVEKKPVTWDLTLESELSPSERGDIEHLMIVAKVGDEIHRFSPNTTAEELDQRIADINKEQK